MKKEEFRIFHGFTEQDMNNFTMILGLFEGKIVNIVALTSNNKSAILTLSNNKTGGGAGNIRARDHS